MEVLSFKNFEISSDEIKELEAHKYRYQLRNLFVGTRIAIVICAILIPLILYIGKNYWTSAQYDFYMYFGNICYGLLIYLFYRNYKRIKSVENDYKLFKIELYLNAALLTLLNFVGTFCLVKYGGQMLSLAFTTTFFCLRVLFSNLERFVYSVYIAILFIVMLYISSPVVDMFFYSAILAAVLVVFIFYYMGAVSHNLWYKSTVNRISLTKQNKKLEESNQIFQEITKNQIESLNSLGQFVDIGLPSIKNINSPIELSQILKNVLEEIRKNKEKIDQLQNVEKEFMGNMSHEIRTPLNAIIGMAHLLEETTVNATQKDYIDVINNSSKFLHHLISDLLDVSKIDSNKLVLNNEEFDMYQMLNTLQKTYQLKMLSKDLQFKISIDKKLKNKYIGDDMLIIQVLHKLLGNAEKFTEKGEIGVVVSLDNRTDQSDYVRFEVYDTGKGISAEDTENIFNKFVQLKQDNVAKTTGTGLGLAISKKIVEKLGGKISVDSELGKGSKFYFTINLISAKEQLIASSSSNQNEKPKEDDNIDNLLNLKYLIVEDNNINLKYITNLFDNKKMYYDVALNGEEAIEKCKLKKYDVILMDILMPKKDGIEATLEIRKNLNPNQDTVIIALTASAIESQKEIALSSGMNDFIKKPYTFLTLLNTINKNVV